MPLLAIAAVALQSQTVSAAQRRGDAPQVIEATVYVSPDGWDGNPGTAAKPFRSIQRAQTFARAWFAASDGTITVQLESGLYRLTKPLVFGPADSPRPRDRMIFRAAPGALPAVTGSVRIRGWSEEDRKRDIWSAPVPASLQTRQIFVNGTRGFLASGPVPGHLTKTATGYTSSSWAMSGWRNPSQIDFVYEQQLGQMVEPICPVSAIHGRNIVMAQPCWDNSNRREIEAVFPRHSANLVGYGALGAPTTVDNAFELLNQPGQFYLDQSSHRIYYIPRAQQNMATADVEAPAIQTLVEGNGSIHAPVRNIAFDGVEFTGTTWLQPGSPNGFSEVQAGFTLTGADAWQKQGLCGLVPHGTCPYGNWTPEPAAVTFSYDQNLRFQRDRFVGLGAAGLALGDGSQSDRVAGNVFTDISGNGIEIGSVDQPLATGPNQVLRVSVVDNHVSNIGVEYPGADGILDTYSADCVISHNQLDNLPYTGISIGWGGWLDKIGALPPPNYVHDNFITDNLIFDFMQKVSDGGGIYTLGFTGSRYSTGLRVSRNVVYGQLDWGYALKADDGAAWVTYSNNVLYGDDLEFGSPHHDYRKGPATRFAPPFLPVKFVDNYWQSGIPDVSGQGTIQTGNHLIRARSEAPAALLSNAGLEPAYRDILRGQPATVPGPPTNLVVRYAIGTHAYVSWHPALSTPSSPVTSYVLTACPDEDSSEAICPAGEGRSITIAASQFESAGYGIISGLTPGTVYTFTATAGDTAGSSLPSQPSRAVAAGSILATVAGPPIWVVVNSSGSDAAVRWAGPAPCGNSPWPGSNCVDPLLAFSVTITSGTRVVYSQIVASARQLILANTGSPAFAVAGGLTPGTAYAVTVAAITPAGTGPPSPPLAWTQPAAGTGSVVWHP